MAKGPMEMPSTPVKDAETYAEGEAPGDSFSEQIAKLSAEQTKLVQDLVTCFNQKK